VQIKRRLLSQDTNKCPAPRSQTRRHRSKVCLTPHSSHWSLPLKRGSLQSGPEFLHFYRSQELITRNRLSQPTQPGRPVRQPYLTYRPTTPHRLAESISRYRSTPGPTKVKNSPSGMKSLACTGTVQCTLYMEPGSGSCRSGDSLQLGNWNLACTDVPVGTVQYMQPGSGSRMKRGSVHSRNLS